MFRRHHLIFVTVASDITAIASTFFWWLILERAVLDISMTFCGEAGLISNRTGHMMLITCAHHCTFPFHFLFTSVLSATQESILHSWVVNLFSVSYNLFHSCEDVLSCSAILSCVKSNSAMLESDWFCFTLNMFSRDPRAVWCLYLLLQERLEVCPRDDSGTRTDGLQAETVRVW